MILDFPSPASTGTIYTGTNSVIYYYDGEKWTVQGGIGGGTTLGDRLTNGSYNLVLDADGSLALPSLYQGTTSTIKGDSIALQVAPGATWLFDYTGITLPGGNTRIGNVNGQDGIMANTGTAFGVVTQGTNGYVALEWIDNLEDIGSTTTQVAAVVVNSPFASTSGAVQILTGISSGPVADNIWEFGADGVLTAPGHIVPNADLTYDLGSTTTQWRSIYVGTGTIYIGGVALGVSSDNYITVDGNPVITVNTSGNLTIQGDTNLVLGAVVISNTAPAATTPGSQWFNTVDARTYIAYNNQWVDASPTQIPAPATYLDDIVVDGSEFLINGYSLTVDETGTLLVDGEQVTGSGAATDSITSGSYSVSVADTGVVTMATSRGNVEFGALPEIGGSSHFHIMKATSSTEVDLYLGDDYNYVLQRGNSQSESEGHLNDYGVEIGTRDLSTGTSNQYVWRFETDGVLTLSTASTILGNSEDPNVYIETSTTATISTWTFGTNGILTLPAATPVIKGGGTGTDVTIIAQNTATTSTWVFGANGSITFPDTTAQTTAWRGLSNAGDQTLGGKLYLNGKKISDGPYEANSIEMGSTLGLSAVRGIGGPTGGIVLQTGAGNTVEHAWQFGYDGKLTLPDGVIKDGNTEIIPGADAATTTQGGNQVIWTASTSTIVAAKVIVRGQLDYASHAAMWTVNMVKAGDGFNYNITDTIVSTSSYSTSDPTVGIDGSGRFYIEKTDSNDCAYTFSVTEFGTTY